MNKTIQKLTELFARRKESLRVKITDWNINQVTVTGDFGILRISRTIRNRSLDAEYGNVANFFLVNAMIHNADFVCNAVLICCKD